MGEKPKKWGGGFLPSAVPPAAIPGPGAAARGSVGPAPPHGPWLRALSSAGLTSDASTGSNEESRAKHAPDLQSQPAHPQGETACAWPLARPSPTQAAAAKRSPEDLAIGVTLTQTDRNISVAGAQRGCRKLSGQSCTELLPTTRHGCNPFRGGRE